jgi:Dolichyl-phosphate-mannose-protein mannosyltransferase
MDERDSKRTSTVNATAILLGLAALRLVLTLAFSGRYGYFRDELYYIACSDHLALGYVDQPPLSIGLLAVNRALFGDSLFALRLIPGLAGALVVLLSGLIARKLGAGKFGQVLAALAALISPGFLSQSRYYSMNILDILFWTVAVFLALVIVKDDRPRLWPLFGVVVGLGLQNKYSIGFLVVGLVAGLLLTTARKHLLKGSFWIGAALAALIFLPHVLWEVRTGFPSVEFMRNASLYKNMPISPLGFFLAQVMEVGLIQAFLWLAGLGYFFFHREGKRLRLFGWMYVVVFLIMIATRAKAYYLAPIYPVLLAGGAVLVEEMSARSGRRWLRPVTAVLLVIFSGLAVPFVIPVLHVESFIAYQDFLGLKPEQEERTEVGILPQHYADMFGWEEMTAMVAEVYQSLPPEERAGCLIYVRNYGEAGAIDFFGPKYGLPKASCGHNNYWLWGPPDWDGKVAIVFGDSNDLEESTKDMAPGFATVEHVATFTHKYVMPYENGRPIFICRGAKGNIKEIWPREKNFN